MYVARFALRKATLLMLIITREKKGKKKITYKKKYKEEMIQPIFGEKKVM